MEKQITIYGIVNKESGCVYGTYVDQVKAYEFVSNHPSFTVTPLHGTYTLPKKLVTKTKTMWASDLFVDSIERKDEFSSILITKNNDQFKHKVTITYQVEE